MRTLVIGGAASGKSEYAEMLAMQGPEPRTYIATLIPQDEEDRQRIQKHRAMRAEKGFSTIERYTDISGLRIPGRGTALLECLGNLTANEQFSDDGAGSKAYEAILLGMGEMEGQCGDLIVVTNDVFAAGGAYEAGTLGYMETLGRLNRELARRFDRVAEVVCGIPILRKEVWA